jgi:hypothetical protein
VVTNRSRRALRWYRASRIRNSPQRVRIRLSRWQG